VKLSTYLSVITISLFATIDVAYGQIRLKQYFCDDNVSCNGDCTYTKIDVVFLVDKKKSAVMRQFFQEGKVFHVYTYENCPFIFNPQNWDCSEHAFDKMVMINGVASYKSRIGSDNVLEWCAK